MPDRAIWIFKAVGILVLGAAAIALAFLLLLVLNLLIFHVPLSTR